MLLPEQYLEPEELRAVGVYCTTAQQFLERHCAASSERPAETVDCPICWSPLNPQDTTAVIFGDSALPENHNILHNNVCDHVFHVGCIDMTIESSRGCPMCRRIWYGPTQETSNHLHPITALINDLRNGKYQGLVGMPGAEVIEVNASELGKLVRVLAFFLLAHGKQQPEFAVASTIANSPDGRALVGAMLAHLESIDGETRDKFCVLVEYLPFYTVRRMRKLGDDRPMNMDMSIFLDVLVRLLNNTYARPFA